MKLNYLIVFTIIFCSRLANSQDFSSLKNVNKELKNVIELDRVEENKKVYYNILFKEISLKHPLYDLFTENQFFFDYLFSKYSVGGEFSNLPADYLEKVNTNPLLSLNNIFFDSLASDKRLGAAFTHIVCNHLISKGYRISDYKPLKKIKSSEKELISIGARFFYLNKNEFNKLENSVIKVVSNKEDINTTLKEALCYQAISLNYKENNFELKNNYYEIYAKIQDISADSNEEIENYRNQVYKHMESSLGLKKSLFNTINKTQLKSIFAF